MTLSHVLLALAAVGLVLAFVQVVALAVHRSRPAPAPRLPEPISVLKPLCGFDDDLETNLEVFAHLDHPAYEVLLGVRDLSDPAVPIARRIVWRYPQLFRLVVQEGEPGANPKVNQLVTLARQARHDLVVVSDSNVQVPAGYLREIAGYFADRSVGIVTHPVVGVGERTLGAAFDAMHLAGIAAGMVGGKLVAGQDFVVGKSMALRRSLIDGLGGFAVAKDVLAEDWVLGRLIPERTGARVVVAHAPVFNVSRDRSVRSFVDRYTRWAVMQRKAVGNATYAAMLLLNPVVLALAALAFRPGAGALGAALGVVVAKGAIDAWTGALLRPGGFPAWALCLAFVKDLLVGAAWLAGLVRETVDWRGNRLVVHAGTRIEPLREEPVLEPVADRIG